MLFDNYTIADLEDIIIRKEDYHPLPVASERKKWVLIDDKEKIKFIFRGEEYLDYNWPSLTATLYMEYYKTGNRSHYENLYFKRRYALCSLIIAECLEGKGRFLDQIVNGIWLILEESTWVIPAHNIDVANNYKDILSPEKTDQGIDLFSAETGALLSWTYYLLKEQLDTITPRINERIEKEVNERIIDQYLKRDDIWWMGFYNTSHHINNWNPCVIRIV